MSLGVTFWSYIAGLVVSAFILVPLVLMLRSGKRPGREGDDPEGPVRP